MNSLDHGLALRETPASPRGRRHRRRPDFTPVLRLYTRRRSRQLRRQNAVDEQEWQLRRLISAAAATRFGRNHGFAGIDSVEAYQLSVPLRRYEAMWDDYWKGAFPILENCTWPGRIPFFAQSSGTTTGITKYIPCSRAMIASNRRATLDLVTHHLDNRPDSALFAGRNFVLGGSTQLSKLAPSVWSGDLSGIAGRTLPTWARPFYFPPRALETIADWEEKIARFAPASLDVDIRALGGTPSWLLLFLEKLAELRPEAGRKLAGLYPNLEMLVHGGVSFTPYRPLFTEWLKGSQAETREVYPASEGFIAVADRGDGQGLRLIVDNGLFYEFVPVSELDSPNPTRHWLANAELGVNYALVLSTCAGAWSYVIGDTIRFVDLDPPRIVVTGRTSYSLSAFGEHVIGEEIERAVTAGCGATGLKICDFSVGATFPASGEGLGGHLYIIEFAGGVPDQWRIAAFADALDATLCDLNDDYRVHRSQGFGMRAPAVRPVPPGTFAAWMKRRGKLGGQNKVPRVITDTALFEDLRTFKLE